MLSDSTVDELDLLEYNVIFVFLSIASHGKTIVISLITLDDVYELIVVISLLVVLVSF